MSDHHHSHHLLNFQFFQKLMLKTTFTGLRASFSLSISLVWSDPSGIQIGLAWIHAVFDRGYVSGKAGHHAFKSQIFVNKQG